MRIWNAHRQVFLRRPLPTESIVSLKRQPNGWRKILSEDVVKFVDDLEAYGLAGSEEEQRKRIELLIRNPIVYFSQPKNVPIELRKQIYL
jgi:hypothetical protein